MYVHQEHDHHTGHPELRLLLATDGTWDGLLSTLVCLNRPTPGAAIADTSAVDDTAATDATGVGHGAPKRTTPTHS